MTEPTPMGGSSMPNNIVPMSVDQAADAFMGLLGAEEKQPPAETPKEPAQISKEEVKQEAETQEVPQVSKEAPETEASSEEIQQPEAGPTFDTLDELSEATGLPIETLLNLKTRVKVDGEESIVPLRQLLKSYQLEGHLNRKTMELAEQRKALEAERETAMKDFQGRLQQADTLVKTLEDQFMKDMNSVDWTTLRATDLAEYSARRQDFIERNFQIQNLKQAAVFEAQKLQQEQTEKQQALYQDFLKKEQEMLNTKLPEWSDSEKAKSEKIKLRSYLLDQGFKDAEVANIGDHRAILLARKAMLYDESLKQVAVATKKVTPVPKFVKPGAKRGEAEAKADKSRESMARLQKSGRLDDAADVLLERFFKG